MAKGGVTFAKCYDKIEQAWHLMLEAEQELESIRESPYTMDRVRKARIEMDSLAYDLRLDTPEQKTEKRAFQQSYDERMPIGKSKSKKTTNKEQA